MRTINLSLRVDPRYVRAGDRVQLMARAEDEDLQLLDGAYYFALQGGSIVGDEGSRVVEVETIGLAPGQYEVKAHFSAGPAPWDQTDATNMFCVLDEAGPLSGVADRSKEYLDALCFNCLRTGRWHGVGSLEDRCYTPSGRALPTRFRRIRTKAQQDVATGRMEAR